MTAPRNPWLEIPLEEYEGHMALPQIGQAQLIAAQLGSLVHRYSPRCVAVAGCAGGNGFEHFAAPGIERVVGIDINPLYIQQTRQRYSAHIPGLELHVANIEDTGQLYEPVELTYAALVLEYVDVAKTLSSFRRHTIPGGILAVLLQMPHNSIAHVSASPYKSLQKLGPGMHLVSPVELQRAALQAGFDSEESQDLISPAGKHFALQTFRAS